MEYSDERRYAMKLLLVITLAFMLTGCGALTPTATSTPVAASTATPVVLVQTVVVTVIPTQAPTEAPTGTAIPTLTPQIIVVTATSGAASPVNKAQASAPTTVSTATLPANAGGDLFTNLTRSSDRFALKCQPDMITFGVSTANPYVRGVDLYYRIEDRLSVSISGWVNGGTMQTDKQGNFTIDFPAARVGTDLRSHKAWFDYQFVGTNKSGDAVGRSAKISKQITYTIDCSD
jgi:hypothetical protein